MIPTPPPMVSVIMACHNAQPYISASINSILTQSLRDLELVIVDDGSTDGTADVIKGIGDPRVKFIQQGNRGVASARNRALKEAKGQFIAIQDADDISLPRRLEVQSRFLERNPEYVVVGSYTDFLWDGGETRRGHRHPRFDTSLQIFGLFDSYIANPTAMIRASVLQKSGTYRESFGNSLPEDFDLWVRISRLGKLRNLAQVLVLYRQTPTSLSEAEAANYRRLGLEVSVRAIRNLAPSTREEVATLLSSLVRGDINKSPRKSTSLLSQSLFLLFEVCVKASLEKPARMIFLPLVALRVSLRAVAAFFRSRPA